MVLQAVNDKEFKIIDGQQRITTLMLLILAALENIKRIIEYSGNESTFALEHILPKKWRHYTWWSGDFEDGDSEKLGNMTLLDRKSNKEISTKSFSSKKEVFLSSSYLATSSVAKKFDIWSHNSIAERQKWLAEQAAMC